VSILLRKNKKTRAVGLSAIPLSLQPLPSLRSVQWPPAAWLQSLTQKHKQKEYLNMKRLFVFLISVFLLASTACANGNKETKSPDKGELSDMKISIQITSDSGNHNLTATLTDNSSATAFYQLLEKGPLTVDMHDYGSFEKVGSLGTSLPRNDTQITTTAGDIILYQGNQITIYYDTNSWNFTRLGKVDGVTQAELKKILGKGDVTAVFEILR
jgi:hypothetical protein